MGYTYFPSDLTKGLSSLLSENPPLIRTFATVIEVESEGLFVSVVLDILTLGDTILNHIPVLKSPYLNTPIWPGDKVFLTTTTHLLNDYFTTAIFIDKVMCENYVAIPVILEPTMQANEFTNDYTYLNPERTYRELINASMHEVTGETIDEIIKLQSSIQEYSQDYSINCNNYTLEAKSSVTIEAESSVTIEAESSVAIEGKSSVDIESPTTSVKGDSQLNLNAPQIDLGSNGVKLGSLLGQLCDALASSTTTTVGGPSTQTGQTLSTAGQVSSIGSQIRSVFK